MRSGWKRTKIGILAGAVGLLATALPGTINHAGAATPKGSLTEVQVDLQWPNLDPALNTQAAADENLMGSIYGYLFEQGPDNSIIPDLASGYTVSKNGKTVTIELRHGVKFQDGTPFNATAVASNIERVLDPKNACICDSDFSAIKKITTSGQYDVVLHLSQPDSPIIEAFIESAPNWTVSPTALAKEGATAFRQHPIGAGPFEVVSNVASNKLVLKAYPGYWNKGEPKLSSLTFLSIGDDTAALEAVESGSAQVAEGIGNLSTVASAKKAGLQVINVKSPNSSGIELNTAEPPFNNVVAREAVYYATDSTALQKALDQGAGVVTQSPTGPGGSFYEPKVPGYRTYNLAKAKQLVRQLGGLTTTISAPSTSNQEVQLMEAIASEWTAAGIKVQINPEPLGTVIQQYQTKSWGASLAGAGGPDPDIGIQGLEAHVGCNGPLSGTCDENLDTLISRSSSEQNATQRGATFKKIFSLISNKAYEVYLYATNVNVVATQNVKGMAPNDSSGEVNVYWETVSAPS